MSKLSKFVKLPNQWIETMGLRAFGWNDHGSDNLAALMTLAVLAHHADPETGITRITYSDLGDKASLSRAKISAGLTILAARGIIDREAEGRSCVGICNYDPKQGWAMIPARGLYKNDVVEAFTEFRLRRRAELDAMKLYFLFASRRARKMNMALLSYEKIHLYSGVAPNLIRNAISVLSANGLIHVERLSTDLNAHSVSNGYRLAHLEPRLHMGSIGRTSDLADLLSPE
jgi:DNA-binding transcriptional ArsR family regulator